MKTTTPRIFDLQIATDTEGRNYTHYAYINPEDGDVEEIKGKRWNNYFLTEAGADKYNIKSPAYCRLVPMTWVECNRIIGERKSEIRELKSAISKISIEEDADEYARSAVESMRNDTCTFNKESFYNLVKAIYVQVAEHTIETIKTIYHESKIF